MQKALPRAGGEKRCSIQQAGEETTENGTLSRQHGGDAAQVQESRSAGGKMKKAHTEILQRKFAVKENRGIEQPPDVKSNWEFRVSLHFLRNLKQGDVTACVCAAWENRGGAGETLTGGESSFQRPQGGAGCGRDVGLRRAPPVGSRRRHDGRAEVFPSRCSYILREAGGRVLAEDEEGRKGAGGLRRDEKG